MAAQALRGLRLTSGGAQPADDARARLGASMLMAPLVAAYERALRVPSRGGDPQQAMLPPIVRGGTGVRVALADTPCTDPSARP